MAYERLHAAQVPGPLHRVAAGLQLGGANDLIGRIAQLDLRYRCTLRHVDRAEKCRHEPQLDNWRSAVQLEALLGQRAAGGRV